MVYTNPDFTPFLLPESRNTVKEKVPIIIRLPALYSVGVTGFEPATTRPPDAYSNRAELHPALLFCVCKGTYLRGLCKFSPLFFCFSGDISSLCCCNMLIIKYFFCLLELILFVSVCTELSLIF